jgi:hypothetical protein
MPNLTCSAAFRRVLAVAMTLGLFLSLIGTAVPRNSMALAAAEAMRPAESSAHVPHHGHVHEDDVDGQQSLGHTHGHNPADHSHETPNTMQAAGTFAPAIGGGWHPRLSLFIDLETASWLERPPRLSRFS